MAEDFSPSVSCGNSILIFIEQKASEAKASEAEGTADELYLETGTAGSPLTSCIRQGLRIVCNHRLYQKDKVYNNL